MTGSFLLLVTEKAGCQNGKDRNHMDPHIYTAIVVFSKYYSPVLLVQSHMLNR